VVSRQATESIVCERVEHSIYHKDPEFAIPFCSATCSHPAIAGTVASESNLLDCNTRLSFHSSVKGGLFDYTTTQLVLGELSMDVQVEPYITAREGMAVYVQNPSYTDVEGVALLVSAKDEGMLVDPKVGKVYYHDRIYRRRSNDNGVTWVDEPNFSEEDPRDLTGEHRNVPMHVLDPNRNVLISFYSTYDIDPNEPMFRAGNLRQRTYRMFYQLSRDGGRSWSGSRQVIDCRDGHDSVQWAPILGYRERGAMADMLAYTWLEDGSLVFGMTVMGTSIEGVIYSRARWNEDSSDLEFTFGDLISVGPEVTRGGCCEPAVTCLGGERLFNAMRCQGDEASGLYSTRQCTVSEDGGMTWSDPEPLRYEDGETVWNPASFSQFIKSTKTGKTYWFANILPGPVHGQTPRYPLTIAEFDPQRCCILKETVRVIHDLPEGAPDERRYTNWGLYEERGSGDLVMTLPEQPKFLNYTDMTKAEEFTADCIRVRIKL
jgi:hypothetical protein